MTPSTFGILRSAERRRQMARCDEQLSARRWSLAISVSWGPCSEGMALNPSVIARSSSAISILEVGVAFLPVVAGHGGSWGWALFIRIDSGAREQGE